MTEGNDLWLLLFGGPVGAGGLYWGLYRYYRNTDKSHGFESETAVEAKPVTGSDQQVGEVKGTQKSSIDGGNLREYRKRVRRVRDGNDTV